MLMVLDIFFDNIFRNFISHCAYKIPIFPKFTTPQFHLNFWIYLKNLPDRIPFKSLYYLRYRIPRWKSQKDMHVFFCYFHRFYFKIIPIRYFFKNSLNIISNISSQYPFPIFRSPYQMVPCMRISHDLLFWLPCVYLNRLSKTFKG